MRAKLISLFLVAIAFASADIFQPSVRKGADTDFTGNNSTVQAFRWIPNDLAGGTTLNIGSMYYDSISAGRTLTFSGTPANGSKIGLRLIVSSAPTLNFPSSRRVGQANSPITSLALTNGIHWLVWEYQNSLWWLTDSVPSAVDLAADVGSSVLPVGNGGNGTSTPTLSAGTGIGLSGSWPNYTISATGSSSPLAPGAQQIRRTAAVATSTTWSTTNGFSAGSGGTATYTVASATEPSKINYASAATSASSAGFDQGTTTTSFGQLRGGGFWARNTSYAAGVQRFQIGPADGAITGGAAPTGVNYCFLRWDTAAGDTTTYKIVTNNGGASPIVASSTGTVDGNWHWFEYIRDGSTGVFTWYIDGVSIGTGSTALPTTSAIVRNKAQTTTLENVAKSIDLAFVYEVSGK